MKFSEIHHEDWEQLAPYLDTCLLPVTGLQGTEKPYEVTEALEKLRDLMDLVEIPYKGRIVTYPSIQYGQEEMISLLNSVCLNLKKTGFKYVVLMSSQVNLEEMELDHADLILTSFGLGNRDKTELQRVVNREIEQLWQGAT